MHIHDMQIGNVIIFYIAISLHPFSSFIPSEVSCHINEIAHDGMCCYTYDIIIFYIFKQNIFIIIIPFLCQDVFNSSQTTAIANNYNVSLIKYTFIAVNQYLLTNQHPEFWLKWYKRNKTTSELVLGKESTSVNNSAS